MKSKFKTQLIGHFIGDQNFQLDEPLVYYSKKFGMIGIPKGFQTDFASFKVGFMRLYIAKRPAVLHDRQILYWAVKLFGHSSYKGGL
jgi:hypothetical protein